MKHSEDIREELLRVTASDRGMRKLQKKWLHYLYCTCNIIMVNKSRMMTLVGHLEGMGEGRNKGTFNREC
jgi:hypothetical protein